MKKILTETKYENQQISSRNFTLLPYDLISWNSSKKIIPLDSGFGPGLSVFRETRFEPRFFTPNRNRRNV